MNDPIKPKLVAPHEVAQPDADFATKREDTLADLTYNCDMVAQMSIAFADQTGYLNHACYAVITPEGDKTSENLPFLIDATRIPNTNKYSFLSYNAQSTHTVDHDFQVLVYSIPNEELTVKQQYKLLCQFANQFEADSLIGQVLSPALLHWLGEHSDMPDIFREYQRARNAINSIEGHLDDLEELI